MLYIVTKYAVTAFIIVAVSEIAKKSDKLGALISSLPIVTTMVMIWLFVEKQTIEKISNHAFYTFWYVIPTLPMFLLMPYMMKKGASFVVSLLAGCLLTFLCFTTTALIAKKYGVNLFP